MPLRTYSQYSAARAYAWGLCHYFLTRCDAVRDGVATRVPLHIDGKDVDLTAAFWQLCGVVLAQPPPARESASLAEHYAARLESALGVPVARLEEDFREFILRLEPRRPGVFVADGRRFLSAELGFEVATPTGWTWAEPDHESAEAIRLQSADGAAQAVVWVRDRAERTLERWRDDVEGKIGYSLKTPYIEGSRARGLGGWEAYEIRYEAERRQPEGEDREPTRFRHVVAAAQERVYEVILSADESRFAESQPSFAEILRGFRILEP